MSRLQIDVKILRSGQPRPYADRVYEAEITGRIWWDSLTGEREGTWTPSEAQAKVVARAFVQPFSEDPAPGALDARLKTIIHIPGGWRVVVVEPYCD